MIDSVNKTELTLSNLSLPLSSSSTTSRELLPQFLTYRGWRWLEVSGKWQKYIAILLSSSIKNHLKTPRFRKLGHASEIQNDALMHREGLKGFND